ncbi:hypothetical protein JXA56_02920 [Candidatus Micrarchaeota archaeon]|nr:hypothetical protein [Candidatus Micrarchaeota archaeon]
MVKGSYSVRPQDEVVVVPASQSEAVRIAKFVFNGEGNLHGIHPKLIWDILGEIEKRTNVPGDYFIGFETQNPVVRANRLQTRFASVKKLRQAKEARNLEAMISIVMDSRHDLDIRNDAAWEVVELARTPKELEAFLREIVPVESYFGGTLARAGQKLLQLKYEERELGNKSSFGPREASSKPLGRILRK